MLEYLPLEIEPEVYMKECNNNYYGTESLHHIVEGSLVSLLTRLTRLEPPLKQTINYVVHGIWAQHTKKYVGIKNKCLLLE